MRLEKNFNLKYYRVGLAFLLLLLWGCADLNNNGAQGKKSGVGAKLVQGECSSCHKFSGTPESKFNLKAPDLMWGGVKYQRAWLERWLQGQEEHLYPNGYRWDQGGGPDKHLTVSKEEAMAVADYFEANLLDDRVKKNPIDLSQFTEQERDLGAVIYKNFSCFGCHQIKDDGEKVGGPISINLYDSGNRYNVDWLYRFALNPQDFTPHSGEYLADVSGLGVRYIVGYLMTLGIKDYKFYEPWKSEYFQKADAKRGATVYKNYCTQCHGMEGKGDGPGAAGLDPKPAVHATLPLSDYPEDYLYNVVYYGGKTVGKSPDMPDWGLTIPPQDLADVIAYLRATFKSAPEEAAAEPAK
jgi:mono/diheme cytochrome c family protein